MSIAVCRYLSFFLPCISPHHNGSKSNFFPSVCAVEMAIVTAVISLPVVLLALAAATSDGRVRRKIRNPSKLIYLRLFFIFGPSVLRSRLPPSSGPSCSVPYCPPFLLGASGSCSFGNLTDVTKVTAYILSTLFAMF
jgi:hypothetical protein